jgi:epoxyqueuosine reductase
MPESCSVVVLALEHAESQPERDWWDKRGGRTPGNRRLIGINHRLAKWIGKTYAAAASDIPYEARNGVFLKDAAVLAGIGVMGRNNLVITPHYGPRVRFRALLVDLPLPCTGPLEAFAPCEDCDAPCQRACPRDAFEGGHYQRRRCRLQMEKDESVTIVLNSPVVGMPTRFKTAYCRRCELSCPVGR